MVFKTVENQSVFGKTVSDLFTENRLVEIKKNQILIKI
jgi:hypothetical protein